MLKLNLGCGKDYKEGWVNVDVTSRNNADLYCDLNKCKGSRLPYQDNTVDSILLSHTLEHIDNSLDLMEELHRVATHGAMCEIIVPYGSSNDAFEDQTHVRRYFEGSFKTFAQPYYWKADYNYRGDWEVQRVLLLVSKERFVNFSAQEISHCISVERNTVLEMRAYLTAVKPIRNAKKNLLKPSKVELQLV